MYDNECKLYFHLMYYNDISAETQYFADGLAHQIKLHRTKPLAAVNNRRLLKQTVIIEKRSYEFLRTILSTFCNLIYETITAVSVRHKST